MYLQAQLCPIKPTPGTISFLQFRIVYSQSSFSRLTKSSSCASCSRLPQQRKSLRTGASWKSQKRVSVGRRQLRNDNHTQLSQTASAPKILPDPLLPRALGAPQWGTTPRKRNAENKSSFLFSVCLRVNNTSELPFQLRGQAAVQTTQGEEGVLDSRTPTNSASTGRWQPGPERVNRQSALADSSDSKVQPQSEPPRRNCKSQGSI